MAFELAVAVFDACILYPFHLRNIIIHRMDVGDLPFRYVGERRRAKLKDVLAFKEKVDAQQALMKELTEIGKELWERYGV